MSKKMKVILMVVLAVVLLVAGVAIPVMAADSPTPPVASQEGLLDRVARILGVQKDALVAALKQARGEFKGATPTPEAPAKEAYLDRVAQILGIQKDALMNAFKQASKELRDETFPKVLDKAVEKGLITREEADEIKEWFAARPPVADRFLDFRFLRNLKARRAIRGHLQKPQGYPTPGNIPAASNFYPLPANGPSY